jgi:hypothetical protein
MLRTYYGLYYDFILERRMELYDSLHNFAERLTEFATLEGTDCQVLPTAVTIRATTQAEAETTLKRLAKGLK